MRAVRTDKLFQILLGPGQIRYWIAGKASWPVTAGALPEVPQRWGTRASRSLGPRQRAQASPEAALHRRDLVLLLVAEDVGRRMDPVRAHPDVGPSISRVPQAPRQQARQSTEFLGHGPLFSTRSILAVIAVRRSWSVSPEASRGGRPSSVRALRTAAQ